MRQWREVVYRCVKGKWCTHRFGPWQKIDMEFRKIRHCVHCGRSELT